MPFYKWSEPLSMYVEYATDLQSELPSGSPDSPSVEDPWLESSESLSYVGSETTQPTVSSSSKTSPEHYRGAAIEPWDFIESQGFDFFLGNAVKYISRAGKKPGESAKDDLEKAIVYLNKKLSTLP
jgi:hypothetical protein